MSTLIEVKAALGKWPSPIMTERGIRVPTHCLYPSNSVVSVVVHGSAGGFHVDDDGAALDELAQSINTNQDVIRSMTKVVRYYGLAVSQQGAIMSRVVQKCELETAVILVANASKAAEEHILNNVNAPRRNLKSVIENILNLKFTNRWNANARLTGASNKSHMFDYLVNLNGGRQLVLDIVTPESTSINAAVVAHLDVSNAGINVEQRIVYDDSVVWRASDIALMRVGARPVPFSSFQNSLDKLAS